MLRWTLLSLGALFLLVMVCIVIGALTPRGHVASTRTDLTTDRDVVWGILVDFPSWATWNPSFSETRVGDPEGDKPVWIAKARWGEMPMVVDRLEAPSLLVTRIPSDANIGFTGSWTYVLSERPGGGCTLQITERGDVPNPFFRFMMKVRGTRATQMQFARDLGRRLGEEVHPMAVDDIS